MHAPALGLSALLIVAAPGWSGTRHENHTLPLKAGATLKVITRNGAIEVQGWDREEVSLTADIQDSKSRPIRLEVHSGVGRLEIEAVFPESRGWYWFGTSPACSFTLKVPRRLVAEYRTSNARIDARGLQGTLTFTTSNGRVVLEDLAGTVEAKTSNGALRIRNLDGDLRASSSNGSAEVERISGRVDVSTSNGAVRARDLDGHGKGIRLITSNGSVTLDLGKATGTIEATTSRHEQVRVDRAGVEFLDMAHPSRVRLRIPGSAQTIELRTSNGGITLH